ncbi:hypothetical protein S1OALGB6SA_2290 [Olavius algarvensis spirochete endosymbiont]|nr:MAG: hypothetical protein [Olavius algarvensis spirochete endosymbiont]VDB01189.1 hypothetical protein S1OALGB6SA_2290 [Olavius algarvensis spirochete endosymbiont]
MGRLLRNPKFYLLSLSIRFRMSIGVFYTPLLFLSPSHGFGAGFFRAA